MSCHIHIRRLQENGIKQKHNTPPHISSSSSVKKGKGGHVGPLGDVRTLFVRVQRYHVPLKVLGTGEAFRTTRNGTDVCALPCFVRLLHPSSAAFLDQVRNGSRRRNTLAWSGTLDFPLFRGRQAVDEGT